MKYTDTLYYGFAAVQTGKELTCNVGHLDSLSLGQEIPGGGI